MTAPTAPTAPTARSRLRDRLAHLRDDDAGMSTAEYAIGTVAAAAFGAILYQVVTGESIVGALTGIVQRALTSTF
ncbi:DUF4244 domain-containing protein [Actinomycetospora lutea]|uniref:DUF4244 domain-containing protein n=1 Tax=Actinomycetospora lutea TaxID=663604 RepID=UPI002366CAAA|nr:DUF4244 domain-containing protein [Actinomycetospora lutea]MDD7941714.1 DUF4244 domain-containing protein [Actinomycetospora lutea]